VQLRETGADLVQTVHRLNELGGRETRLAPTAAFREFERAMTAYRATAIRLLVDDNGMSFSDVGKLIGVSRQMVARLYRAGAVALEETSE
jgi:hypothetical protein